MNTRDTTPRNRPYALPRPCASEEEYARFYHLDLADLRPWELWAENYAAQEALAALVLSGERDPVIVYENGKTISGSSWLRERVRLTQGGRP